MVIEKLKEIIAKPKFGEEKEIFYPGLEKIEMKGQLTELINLSIEEFIVEVQKGSSDVEFQKIIFSGLNRFDSYDLDTEDRERICGYYEEIMDAIELQSSGGVINKWLYGFDF